MSPEPKNPNADPDDPRTERAVANGVPEEGLDFRDHGPEDFGLKEQADAIAESGTFPPSGPPGTEHTFAAQAEVVKEQYPSSLAVEEINPELGSGNGSPAGDGTDDTPNKSDTREEWDTWVRAHPELEIDPDDYSNQDDLIEAVEEKRSQS